LSLIICSYPIEKGTHGPDQRGERKKRRNRIERGIKRNSPS
jgi:hypothetical protein